MERGDMQIGPVGVLDTSTSVSATTRAATSGPSGGLVHRSEMSLVDHAGLTKLVVVLNIQTMHIICNRFRRSLGPASDGGASYGGRVGLPARSPPETWCRPPPPRGTDKPAASLHSPPQKKPRQSGKRG